MLRLFPIAISFLVFVMLTVGCFIVCRVSQDTLLFY